MEDKKQRLKYLIDEINKHNYNYYTLLEPTISDQEYDKLYYELVDLEQELGIVEQDSPTQRVGGDVQTNFEKHTHSVRLYSLNKVRSSEELSSWVQEMKSYSPDTEISLEYKFDGLQLVLEYEEGKFIRATTRGNGRVGEDVTNQVRTIRSVPLSINYKERLVVQGEGMMTQSSLKKYNETAEVALKNARNGVAGAIRNLDPKETAKRRLDYFCYSILECGKVFSTQEEMHKFLQENNFKTGDFFKLCKTEEELIKEIEEVDKVKEKLDVMIDGVVLKINDVSVREDIGYTNKFPKWAMAYKFAAQEVSTILEDVIWQVGRTGKVTPIAILEPTELAGATIQRATLNNFDDITKKRVMINSKVLIRRSNEVIPEVLGLLESFDDSKEITEPKFCPSCGSVLVKKGPLLYCTNRDGCYEQKVDRISHFASRDAMNIDGLSIKTIEQFCKSLSLSEPAELYSLTKEQLLSLEKVKEKKATNLLNAIEKSKEVSLDKFIYAIGIPEVGDKTARDLAEAFKSLDNLMSATFNELIQINDVGEIIANNILQFFDDEQNIKEINDLINCGVIIKSQRQSAKIESEFTGKK
ncbi:MAG: NAD-dependent DNA ligase LigA, partial [Clostridia bacterium]|nr:NAD-dependent DNA ligase LigA [Clostridia bacterium]